MRVNHIGYIVGDLEKAVKEFKVLGYKKTSEVIEDKFRNITICFMKQEGYVIELVSPQDETSIIHNMYKKMGNTPYHICYEVVNIIEQVDALKTQGYILVQPIQKAVAFEDKNVAFLFHKAIGLIELVEV